MYDTNSKDTTPLLTAHTQNTTKSKRNWKHYILVIISLCVVGSIIGYYTFTTKHSHEPKDSLGIPKRIAVEKEQIISSQAAISGHNTQSLTWTTAPNLSADRAEHKTRAPKPTRSPQIAKTPKPTKNPNTP
eukprot:520395_1